MRRMKGTLWAVICPNLDWVQSDAGLRAEIGASFAPFAVCHSSSKAI